MASLLLTHRLVQDHLVLENISQSQLAEVIHSITALAIKPSVTLYSAIEELKKRTESTQGVLPAATLELLLIAWAANYRSLSKRYKQQLLSQSFINRAKSLRQQDKLPLSQITRCARLIADDTWQGKPLANVFARLSRYRNVLFGMEIHAEVLLQQVQFAKNNTQQIKVRPLPRKLLQAIRHWPLNDEVFPKVVSALEQQPFLKLRIQEQATERTQQRRLLSVKQALLLLGPEASRELLLITHFEAHLTHLYIPLRQELLHRRALLSQCLQLLCEHFAIHLPCHADLLSYLLVYDCWYHPNLSTQLRWGYALSTKAPESTAAWQPLQRPLAPLRALKLVDYWQLPTSLVSLINKPTHSTDPLSICVRLAHIATALISDHGAELPRSWQPQVNPLLKAIGLSWSNFHQLQLRASYKVEAQCPLEAIPL